MSNDQFLNIISNSFKEFLKSGTSRSTAKLGPLHSGIAKDLAVLLGESYTIKSQGIDDGREAKIQGRYIDKKVDITILKNNQPVAGIGVKFVMQNYSQNSNNYFENMLGETANIRANRYPYFQVFIIFDKLPYYNNKKRITKWENVTANNLSKYIILSQDNIEVYFHTPNKTLFYLIHIPENDHLKTREEYLKYYKNLSPAIIVSKQEIPGLSDAVILNNYEEFIDKVFHTIKAQ